MPKFTNQFLAGLTLAPGQKDLLAFDSSFQGLGIRVTAKGTRIFLAQFRDPITKKRIREPIGQFGTLTIEQAKEAVRVRLAEVAKGLNPKTERERQRVEAAREAAEAEFTLSDLIEDWSREHLAKNRRPRYAAEATRALRVGLVSLLNRPAIKIIRDDAEASVDELLAAGKPVAAARLRAYASAAYSWAIQNRWPGRRGLIRSNPFLGIAVEGGSPERERVLDDKEIAEIWAAADRLSYPFGPYFKLLLLTLQRRDTVAGMRWSEIEGDVWRVPGGRMKAKQGHLVHLSSAALSVLRDLPRIEGRDLVFTTTGRTPISGFSQGKMYLDKEIASARKAAGIKEQMKPWVVHDFRRSGATWLAEHDYDSIVIDRILAHQPGKLRGVAGVYQRAEYLSQRAAALTSWATKIVGADSADNVVLLRDGRPR